MGAVYENCFLNIAAADAPDANGGFFYARTLPTLDKPTVQLKYREQSRTFEFVNRDIQGRAGLFPLNQRAWVFQERLLAPRTVHFGRYQVFCECQHVAAASECFPRGIPPYYRGDPDNEAQPPPYSLWSTPEAGAPQQHPTGNPAFFKRWEEIVGCYNTTVFASTMKWSPKTVISCVTDTKLILTWWLSLVSIISN
jgi:hypothetical protein